MIVGIIVANSLDHSIQYIVELVICDERLPFILTFLLDIICRSHLPEGDYVAVFHCWRILLGFNEFINQSIPEIISNFRGLQQLPQGNI